MYMGGHPLHINSCVTSLAGNMDAISGSDRK